MSTVDPDEVVRLATVPNPALAHLWADALKAEGIRCRVVGEYLDAGIGDVSGLLPEIWVKRGDVPRAEEILHRELLGAPEGTSEDDEDDEEAGT
jgi:hypothetical protein